MGPVTMGAEWLPDGRLKMTNTETRSGFKRRVAALAVAAGLLAATAAGCGAAAQGGQGNNQPGATGTRTSAPTRPASTDAGAPAAAVPKPLAAAGEYAENVYDAAKAGDWKTADAKLAALKDSTARLGGTPGAGNPGALRADVAALEKAVGARDQQAALLTSNKATFDAANLSAAFDNPVPVAVTKLDYYGRQVEVQAAAGDTAALTQTAAEVQRTWDGVRSQVVRNGGTAEAKEFDGLVAQLQRANTPDQYGKLATPILDQVDYLEGVFE